MTLCPDRVVCQLGLAFRAVRQQAGDLEQPDRRLEVHALTAAPPRELPRPRVESQPELLCEFVLIIVASFQGRIQNFCPGQVRDAVTARSV